MNENRKTYQEEYDEFWKSIVENEDGTLNKDQVMRELSDYSMVMDNCESAYSAMTNGIVSKANTMFYIVESMFYDIFFDKVIAAEDMIELLRTDDIDELKESIKEYFNITNER